MSAAVWREVGPGTAGLGLARRWVAARYRGSVLGGLWALAGPLVMLAVYVFVFAAVFEAKWPSDRGEPSAARFGLAVFSGLLVFNFLAECLARAPELLREQGALIRRGGVSPWSLGWSVALSAGVPMVVSSGVYLIGYAAVEGPPPATALLWPVVGGLVFCAGLGLVWLVSAAGVFLRDLKEASGVIVTIALFTSPVFYTVESAPERFRWLVAANPVGWLVGPARAVLLDGRVPGPEAWLLAALAAGGTLAVGGALMARSRPAIADEL